jgi:hypothetical protein
MIPGVAETISAQIAGESLISPVRVGSNPNLIPEKTAVILEFGKFGLPPIYR